MFFIYLSALIRQ